VRLVRLWLVITCVILAALAVWAFAPVLLFVALLTVALGLVSAVMIGMARALQAWRERSNDSP
jgi:membrane associated rhomboid family serine protease